MYKGRTKFLISIFAIFTMVALAVVSPALSDDSSATTPTGTNLNVTYTDEIVEVHADGSSKFTLYVTNLYGYDVIFWVNASCNNSDVNVSTGTDLVELADGANKAITVTAKADKYAHQGDYIISLAFKIYNPHISGSVPDEGTYDVKLAVSSNLSSSEQYNRFMGIWDNDFDAPFDEAWFPALVTGIVWILIGFLVRLVAVPVVMNIIMKKDDEDYEPMKKALIRMCFVIIVLNGIGKSIRVLGMGEDVVDTVNRIFYICYIVVILMVAWRIYLVVINWLVKRIGVKDFIPGGSKSDFESLKPLLIYIGEIVFAVVAVTSIMNLLGFNMTAIITSAGIVSLGITMGAQSVLSQFFSGLVILATRPFKAGDMITLNGGSITYRVKRINVMFTEFENWDNTDITIIPNSSLTSGIVKNITRETLKSKVHIYMEVGYGTDLAYARAAMLEVANANPRVIKDGSVSRPSTRVTDFLDSNIQLRLSCFVDDFNDSGVIGGELRQALYNKFNEKGISIDYTQIVVRAPSFAENEEKD